MIWFEVSHVGWKWSLAENKIHFISSFILIIVRWKPSWQATGNPLNHVAKNHIELVLSALQLDLPTMQASRGRGHLSWSDSCNTISDGNDGEDTQLPQLPSALSDRRKIVQHTPCRKPEEVDGLKHTELSCLPSHFLSLFECCKADWEKKKYCTMQVYNLHWMAQDTKGYPYKHTVGVYSWLHQ